MTIHIEHQFVIKRNQFVFLSQGDYSRPMANYNLTHTEGWLTGKILAAMPGMQDSRFEKSVIFMCAHDEKGAMGLVINFPMPDMKLGSLLSQLTIPYADGQELQDKQVLWGGPVDAVRGFILHSKGYVRQETVKITDEFYVTGTLETLQDIAVNKGPEQALFALGYAGWTAGQLEQEIQDNAWLVVEPTPELVFQTAAVDLWEKTFLTTGIHPASISSLGGHA